MHVIILLVYLVLASAAPRHTDNSQEKDDFFPRGSPSKQTPPQLNPLVRKDPHPAALYSEDEIKEYLRNLGDSIPHVSDDVFKAQKEDGPGDSAWNDPASAPADADEGLAPEVYKQGLKNPALNAKPEMDSGDWDTRDPFLADQGQNLEDPADARMPKPADSKKRDQITILIDALRIRNENKRYSRYGRVNDQHDNAAAYPRQWESPEPNGYYGRHTRRSSSPSAEALAMLTQKLSKLQVEVGRLKEVVLLQGAVHIKTSERMEMMLLTQGKLAVKNNLDTSRVLKRVRRCCSCSLRGKRKRALALRLARNGHTRDKSDKEIPRSSDSSPVMNMSFPDKDNNVNEINRQNNGKSDQPQVVERSQSDSHSRGKKNSPSLQIDHRDDGNVREKDKHGADSYQSRKTETDLPQDSHTVDSTTGGFSLSPQQATKSSGTTLGNQYDSNSDSNQPTTVQIDRNQEAPVAQKSADQKDRQRQVATSSEAPTTTTVPTSVDDWTTEAGNSYEVETTSSDRPSTSALNQPRTSPTLVKRLFTVASTAVDKNMQTIHSNGQNTSGSSTWKWSLAADASTTAKKSAASPESSSLLTVLNESKNQHTQIPVLGEPTRSPILDASVPQDEEVVTGSNRKQEDVTEEHPNKQSYNGLDPKTTTPQHMSVTGKATQVMSTAAIDNLSEDERVDEQNVNTNSASYPTAGSTPLSDSDNNIGKETIKTVNNCFNTKIHNVHVCKIISTILFRYNNKEIRMGIKKDIITASNICRFSYISRPNMEPELAVDLSTGQIRNDNLPGATWVVLPSRSTKRKRSVSATAASSGNQLCDMKGVLKFTFTPPHTPSLRRRRHRDGGDDDDGGGDGERRRLLLEMEFRRPYRWVFNIGDSSANNGFSGDGSVQENDCEAQGYGQAFAVYASDKHTNGRQKLLKMADHFIHDKLTLVISDQSISWDNHRGTAANLTHNSLFALSGQYDRQGAVNYDVYLGLNRVIAGHYRRGHGLCRVTARWLKG
ncbi:hypothetical protein ACOMHN_020666 [Nucella lapillus]